MKKQKAMLAILLTLSVGCPKESRADIWGADVGVLMQILIQAIDQVFKLQAILGKATETVRLLEEMNRGVKEVLKLAETAHVPLPPGVYEKAKQIDQAVSEAKRVYGMVTDKAPVFARVSYKSGIEALHLSQDAFDYSTALDKQGEKIKSSAVIANQAAATRLTAETLGVVLHAVNHTNRLEAKSLEISAASQLEESAKENARFESFINTHEKIAEEMKSSTFSSLNGALDQ